MTHDNRLRLDALASSSKIQESKYKIKRYVHFDRKVSFKRVKNKVKDPCWIAQHGFYPFIHFQIRFNKYIKKNNLKKVKKRDIFYASHIDSFIYKYYGDLLNNKYNDIVKELGTDQVATAYRNNLEGKSNIDFAKEVIDFIRQQDNAYIYVADFTSFFDNLDHKYLKEKIKSVLNVKTLPTDFFAVFKNITKYSWIEIADIDKEMKNKGNDNRTQLTRYFSNEREFREFKKNNIHNNKNLYGIPQGAGISSVCSNIYLLEFDRLLNNHVQELNGLYRRYCDDIIIVIPTDDIGDFDRKSLTNFVDNLRGNIPRLEIQPEKTDELYYSDNVVLDLNNSPTKLDYLGFSFDGYNVKIREKSLFKYYSRAYKKVRICNRLTKKSHQKAQRKSLFKNYTHLGKKSKGHGNFLTYATRAQQTFDNNKITNNLMEHQVKNHWKKINSRLEN
ncbi:reverse transcriptase domain-containing protein [Alkalihalobacillus macyae]|uniref:reverse transcriptase domain-containing protein n=1 Tax=Guptibacillus hwajinpoensis TaxID=208199 RepID=UPI00273CB512|nr:reverse transcriptase domain-containing protein [Alkalihalobacillus macyae]MDP4552949.1 reverse transcriptase domain-containing protein [Alkalihalobacillus macyae]